ncbi:MAG: carboxypeptidase-like regulatory domain-containing protein [Ignavibacteriota bacterium]
MRLLAICAIGLLGTAPSMYSQSAGSGTIRGTVLDSSGGAVKGSAVTIDNPVSHYSRTLTTDDLGKFEFDNVPYNNYHLTASAPGFQNAGQDAAVRAAIPVDVTVTLQVAGGAPISRSARTPATWWRTYRKPTRISTVRYSTSCRCKASRPR